MSSFLKSIFGMMTSTNSTKRRKCPDYPHTVQVNNNLYPNVMEGLNVTVNTDVSSVFGTGPTTTFLTNKLTLNPFGSSHVQFGGAYAYNKDQTKNSADQEATVQTSVDADLNGHVVGQARLVTDHGKVDVWGLQEDWKNKIHAMSATANWSGGRFNATAGLSVKTAANNGELRTTLAAECVRQLGDRWTIGGDLTVNMATRGDRWRPAAVHCSGALRYDGERDTFVAEADRAANVSLRYRSRIDDKLTVGAEVTANVRNETTSMTLMHQTRFRDGIEIRSQIDTDGLVVGDMRKAFPRDNFSVGVCASLNYKTNQMGLGVELSVG